MAFNPFQRFRKHQKVIMAGVIMVCMVTFVLVGSTASGRGDIVDWLSATLGWRFQADTVASLHGSEISGRQLAELRKQRVLANEFMRLATEKALENRLDELRKTTGAKPAMSDQEMFQLIFSDKTGEAMQLRVRVPPRGRFYFGGSARMNDDELIDFLIWRQQADKLGIHLSDADVKEEFNRLTLKRFSQKDSRDLEKKLTEQWKDYSPTKLLAALGEELRVRLAQETILGTAPGQMSRNVPAPIAPEEFWEFFKDQRMDIRVALFKLPVKEYLSQVTDKPMEDELKKVYDQGKDIEPSPESDLPAFKQPRRVQVEWVSAQHDSDYYRKAAVAVRELTGALRMFGAASIDRSTTGTMSAVATQLAAGLGVDVELHDLYQQRKWFDYRLPEWTRDWSSMQSLHESSIHQPAVLAATVGQAMGGSTARGAGLGGLVGLASSAITREIQDRGRVGTTLILAGLSPTPITAAVMVSHITPREQFLPLERVKDRLVERVRADKARELVRNDLQAIQKEMATRSKEADKKDKDRKELRKYLADTVQRLGLKTGKTTAARDLRSIGDDPGLRAIKDVYLRNRFADPKAQHFPQMFFASLGPAGTYLPEAFPEPLQEGWRQWQMEGDNQPIFVFWRTEDEPAKTQPYETVRKQVEDAWKFQKARELANKDALSLAEKARAKKGDMQALNDLGAETKKSIIPLGPMARRMKEPSANPSVRHSYEEYKVPEDKVPHAGPEFRELLLGLRKRDKGETITLSDLPKENYYVAVLLDQKDPTVAEFSAAYASATTGNRDPIWTELVGIKSQEYAMKVMERLRNDAQLKWNANYKKERDRGSPFDDE